MNRRAPSVVLATLLLVAQLLPGVTSVGAAPHDASQFCGDCPSVHSGSLSHDHCGSHCSDDGSTGTQPQGCGSGCAMAGSSHCGFSASPALLSSSPFDAVVLTDDFAADRRAVGLPDSPLFDFLRPPTRG